MKNRSVLALTTLAYLVTDVSYSCKFFVVLSPVCNECSLANCFYRELDKLVKIQLSFYLSILNRPFEGPVRVEGKERGKDKDKEMEEALTERTFKSPNRMEGKRKREGQRAQTEWKEKKDRKTETERGRNNYREVF
jgi:hypothetical protein